MMEQNGYTELSGIERELVLQYLIDGNVPVTLTPVEEIKTDNQDNERTKSIIKSLTSQIFPVAIRGEHLKVQKNGEILLENPPQSVNCFANQYVKVEFYFNRVGLYFTTIVKETSKGLSFIIPEKIQRIADVAEDKKYDISAFIYMDCNTSKELNIRAVPENEIQLFTRPAWKCIPLENQQKAKKLLESFVEQAKAEKNAGNGIQLIAVCKYLTEKKVEKVQSLQNRMEPISILFIDHERIVFGVPASQKKYFYSKEYGIKISFSINKGPINAREIFVTGIVNKIYQNEENDCICVDFRYSNSQEEDLRFLYEKATSTLFE